MVTAEDLLKGAQETGESPSIEIKKLYDSVNQEFVTLTEIQKKINFLAQRMHNNLQSFLEIKSKPKTSVNDVAKENSIAHIKTSEDKTKEHLDNIKNNIIPNINKKIEEMAKLVDKNDSLHSYKQKIQDQYMKLSESDEFFEKCEMFLEDIRKKLV